MINIFDNTTIKPIWESCQTKNWVKLITTNNLVDLDTFNNKDYFKLTANIIRDNEIKPNGLKARNTVIRFVPTISKEEWEPKSEWIYLIVINNKIVKIGGTRTGLKERCASYICGHHIPERGKSGDCSKTNGFIYNTLDFYLEQGAKIELWGYQLPVTTHKAYVLGEEIDIIVQTYHAYETKMMENFKSTYGEYPSLNDNCDPDYK